MADTPNLGFPYLAEGQASAHTTHNDALNLLDSLCFPAVEDRNLAAPPGSPAEGSRYIVAASATGDWSGYDKYLAVYYSGWKFVAPVEGLKVWLKDEDMYVVYDGSIWHGEEQVSFVHFTKPVAGDECALFYTPVAATITSVRGVQSGGTNAVIDLRHSTDRSAAGNQVETSNFTVTSTTTGNTWTSGFEDATIPASSYCWADIDSISGSPDWVEFEVRWRKD